MQYPKISIITPSFNQGPYIEQTINSVLGQIYPNLEYIIIDGGSTDDTQQVINKYKDQLYAWISEKDNGQSDAINKGYKIATGEIINWLNSDDYYEPNALYHVSNKMLNPEVTCYIGRSRIFNDQISRFSEGTDLYPNNLFKTIGWARIDQPESFFKKSVFEEIGLINECLHYVMDKDLWIRYLVKFGMNGIRKDDKVLVNFRLHDASKTMSMKKRFEEETRNLFYTYANYFQLANYCKIFRELWDTKLLALTYFPKKNDDINWNEVFNYFLVLQGMEAYALNDYEESRKILKHVKQDLLSSNDLKEFNKVRTRIRFLPVFLKKLINRTTQLFAAFSY